MNLDRQLAQLESAQIVHRVDDPELAYLFKHTLTQETAYHSLLKKARRDIHRQVAQTYERVYADRVDDFAALLETHYSEAGDDAKTLKYATRAGDASARLYANAEAVAHYSIAIDAARRVGARAPLQEIYLKRGRALELTGKYADALASYEEMESLAREGNDHALELGSFVARATLYSTHTPLYDAERAQKFSAQALDLARQIGDRKDEAKILWTQMLFHIYGSGNAQAGLGCGEQSLEILRELSASPAFAQDRAVREQLAYTLNDLLYAYIQVSQLERGLAARLEARKLWRELDNKPMLADNLGGLALAQLTVGESEQAIATAEEAYAIAESVGNPWGMAQGKTMKGYALLELGRFAEALQALHAGDEYATAAETGGALLASRCALATQYGNLGMTERGLEMAQRALDAARRYIPDWYLWPHSIVARLHLMRGDLAAAQRAADESELELSERKLFKAFMPGVASVILAEAELALAKKNYARVIAIVDDAFSYMKGSAPNFLPDLWYVRAQALLQQGQRDLAATALQEARAFSKNSRRMLWQILAASSEVARARGDKAEAEKWRDEARTAVGSIAENLTEELRASFLNLPSVRQVME